MEKVKEIQRPLSCGHVDRCRVDEVTHRCLVCNGHVFRWFDPAVIKVPDPGKHALPLMRPQL